MNAQKSLHGDALLLLLEAMGDFCEVNEIAKKKDNHIFLRDGHSPLSFLEDGSVSYTATIEDVARDLFVNPTLLPQKITMCLEDFLNSQQGSKAERDNLLDYFASDEASLLFEQKKNHLATQNSHVVHEILVGHIGQGWMLSFIGSYGDYQKRDWDVRAVFSVTTGLTREAFSARLASRIEKWARSEVIALAKSIQNTTRNLPQHLQHLVWEHVIKQYNQNDILNPLNTWHERRALREVLKDRLQQAPEKPKDHLGAEDFLSSLPDRQRALELTSSSDLKTPEKRDANRGDTQSNDRGESERGRRKM